MTAFDRLITATTKPWVIVSYIGLMIILFFYIDQPVAYYFHDLDYRTNQPMLHWITLLGSGKVYFAPLFIIAVFFRYIFPNKPLEARAWFLWLCALIPSTICLVLKVVLGRARPDLLFTEHLYGFYGWHTNELFWSFPSGHTTTLMGVIFGLGVLFPRFLYLFIAIGLAIVSSRILLTHHYLSDVLVAAFLALLEVGLLRWWLKRINFLKQGCLL